jgi:hypothetical protein
VFAIWTDDLSVNHVDVAVEGQWRPFVGDNAATTGQVMIGTVSNHAALTEEHADECSSVGNFTMQIRPRKGADENSLSR